MTTDLSQIQKHSFGKPKAMADLRLRRLLAKAMPWCFALLAGISSLAHGKETQRPSATKRVDIPRLDFKDFFELAHDEIKPSAT